MSTRTAPMDNATRLRRLFFGPLTRILNPTIARLARLGRVGFVGLVYHQGRRSGRTYATPLGISMAGGVVLIPLTFGPSADWCRNVLAAGGCAIKWRGHEYIAEQPEVVDDLSAGADLRGAFSPVQRFMLRAMGTHHFMRLRVS